MTRKNFAILTSGGDSPGMNCAIRSFVRTCIFYGQTPYGISRGYTGLIENELSEFDVSSVGNILQRGGTILQSSRSDEFKTAKGRLKALENLKKHNIEGLVVIGGDGSYKGAAKLNEEHGFPVIGIPGTIDNDISGTDYTIGHDTAVQTAVDAVDKIRDTAFSHDRVFLIEVMGRKSISLACKVALATGAEDVVIPNQEIPYDIIMDHIQRGVKRKKKGSIFIVSEGDTEGQRSYQIQKELLTQDIQSRVCILGHIQRGGSPSVKDRLSASIMGSLAARALIEGKTCDALIEKQGSIQLTALSNCLTKDNNRDKEMIELIRTLAI